MINNDPKFVLKLVTIVLSFFILLVAILNPVRTFAYSGEFQETWGMCAPYITVSPDPDCFSLYADSTGTQFLILHKDSAGSPDTSTYLSTVGATGSLLMECTANCDSSQEPIQPILPTYARYQWESGSAYITGQITNHNGSVWVSLMDNPTDEPSDSSTQWEKHADRYAFQFTQNDEYNGYIIMGNENMLFTWNPTDFPLDETPPPATGSLSQAQLEETLTKFSALWIAIITGAAVVYAFRFRYGS